MTCIKKIAILYLMFPLMSCSVQKENTPKIKQGIYGTVTWLQGNMMPSPDEPKAVTGRVVERKLNIYEAVTLDEVQGQAPLFTKIRAKLVKTVKSDAKGFYQCELPVGVYSVFTEEEKDSFFANNFDGKGQINAVKIEPRAVLRLDIQINYKAAY